MLLLNVISPLPDVNQIKKQTLVANKEVGNLIVQ